jgi:hypothetical protein
MPMHSVLDVFPSHRYITVQLIWYVPGAVIAQYDLLLSFVLHQDSVLSIMPESVYEQRAI